ncbi:MAG: hypothetical protein GWO16_07345 [Gammaproteobacteria bacterium]|nr:hypothetical protein [Gammaproteobacteria bacterium]
MPTVAHLLGMLDAEGHVIPQAGAIRGRPFLPYPGRPLLSGEVPSLARPARAGWPFTPRTEAVAPTTD